MIKITFRDIEGNDKIVTSSIGETLMEVAVKNDIAEIEAECGGACSCATCHVYIDKDWLDKVPIASEMEEDMLDFAFDVKSNSRLSCQIKITKELDGLVVKTPESQF
ncbi:MAG: 2Fe-2S iron-sulfur cluster-binding protein [Alphaproteobacteria bacterium]|jgi:2Fe-2S ferredoxin|tara:strand:+ start:172 stop:492 length:321 start_codon:yes stop_codon:yes gene_type:complete